MRLVWPFALFVLALTACSEFQPQNSTVYVPVVSREYNIDYWLVELHNTRAMTPDELRQTVKAWEQEIHDDPSTYNRIKLTLLLTVGDTSVRDLKRAQELLDGLDPVPDNTSDRELITILRQIIDELSQAYFEISKLKKQAGNQSLRIEELEEQQRALTDIEQNIQQRSTPPDPENGGQ